jgi:formate hydrogenlyase transcriptional activator
MERQRNKPVSGSVRDPLPTGSDHDFLFFTGQLNQYRSLEDLLQALPSALHGLVSANTVTVVQIDDSNPVSSFAVSGNSLRSLAPPDFIWQAPSTFLWVHENQKPLMIPSVIEETTFPEAMEWFRSNGDRSLCILPLGTALRPLGVLCVGRASDNAFSEKDVSFLALTAGHVALALDDRLNFAAAESSRLQLENERTKLKLILDLNYSVVSNQEPKQLIQAISPSIRNVMQLDAVALMLPATDKGCLKVYAQDSPNTDGANWRATTFPEDLAEQVFRIGKPWAGDTSGKAPQSLDKKETLQERFQAMCFLPLIRCNRTLGVLSVGRLRKEFFTEQDVDFLLQIAGQIAIAIDNAVAYREISELSDRLTQEKLYFEDEIRNELNFEEIVGSSTVLLQVLRQVQAVAPTDSTVLIYGETGSGKELIARAVHKLSRRSSHPFVKLNCAAIPTGLLESELFGHEKGAFTGAIAQRIGRFELASEGTIFLDEVGEIPPELQPKLLRVLQEREFERLGSSRTLRSDARLIAATNRDLHAMVDEQKFRSDLFYRLNVFPIQVPPLRDRTEDIPFLVRHFAQHFARLMKKQIDTISTETMNALIRYPWPGNIRELQNVIERAVILSSGKELKVPISDLKPRLTESDGSNGVMTLEEMERRHILHVLEQSNWVFSGPNGAAARLGMKRPTLQFRMRKLGISRPLRH